MTLDTRSMIGDNDPCRERQIFSVNLKTDMEKRFQWLILPRFIFSNNIIQIFDKINIMCIYIIV